MIRRLCNPRLLGWSAFALLLAGLAWALHAWLPPEPRWVLRGPIVPIGFGPDGKRYMTGTMALDDLPNWNFARFPSTGPPMGPVQFWDIATGHEAWSVLGYRGPRWQVAFSDNFTHLAAVAPPLPGAGQDELRVIDLTTGDEHYTRIEHRTDFWNVSFSPSSALLMLEDWDPQLGLKDIRLYDTTSLRFIVKCEVSLLPSDDKGRAKAKKLRHLLEGVIEAKDFQDPMPLKQALQLFYEKFAARGQDLPILVDINAFKEADEANPNGPYDDEVRLPAVPRTMTMGSALRLILSQIKSDNATYVILPKFIQVTTNERMARNRWPRWRWSADGKALLLFTTDASGNGRLRRIAADGETTTKLQGAGEWLDISPDGKTLLTAPPRTDAAAGMPIDTILLWDLPAGTRRGAIPVDAFQPGTTDDTITFTTDSRTLLITMGQSERRKVLGACDTDSRQWLGKVALVDDATPLVPEPNTVLLRNPHGEVQLSSYRIRPFGKLWQRAEPGSSLASLDCLAGVERLVVLWDNLSDDDRPRRLQLLDVHTGTPIVDMTLDPQKRRVHWLSRGKLFAVVTRHNAPNEPGTIRAFIDHYLLTLFMPKRWVSDDAPTSARFFDIATGAELCRMDIAASRPIDLTPDGRALLLYQDAGPDGKAAVLCYDVPPGRPWRLIVGIPLALGAVLLILHFGGRRVRRRAAASGQKQP
jgi:hypothetical protein